MEALFAEIAQKIFELEDDRVTKYRAWISGGGPLPAVGGFDVVSLFIPYSASRVPEEEQASLEG